jgi:hypothetical protein
VRYVWLSDKEARRAGVRTRKEKAKGKECACKTSGKEREREREREREGQYVLFMWRGGKLVDNVRPD